MRKGKVAKTVEEYLAGTPEPARTTLKHIRAVIRSVVPKETTEVISYGMPMFQYNGMLVAYAAFKNHCSLFPTGSGVLDQFEKELAGYRTSKGTIQFPADRPLPDALVRKIVQGEGQGESGVGLRGVVILLGSVYPTSRERRETWGTRLPANSRFLDFARNDKTLNRSAI